MISEYNIKQVVRNNLLKGVPEYFFKRFYNPKNFQICKEGTIIYSPGEESGYLYLIVQGEIKVKYSEQKQVNRKYLYDFFGETELRKGIKRISSAVADSECILYKISYDELHTLCNGNIIINKNLKNMHDIKESNQSDFLYTELNLQIPEENLIEGSEIDFSVVKDPQEVFTEVSEEELDRILEKQKTEQRFRSVMKKVGKVEGNELLKQELLGDLNDNDEWRLASN